MADLSRRLALLMSIPAAASSKVPTDIVALNYFAPQYNRYGESIQRGIVDIKQWKIVASAWERLVRL